MKKGIYLIPTIFTLSSLFFGFYSIVSAINHNYETAAIALIAAGFMDLLDGKIARITRSTSHFGVELDSLSDLISFGIAPAILIYLYELFPYGKIGWMASFIFVACGALRLARSNIITESTNEKKFVGLPIPAAAGVIISYVILMNSPYHSNIFFLNNSQVVAFLVYLLAFLMVSNFTYHGFKEFESKRIPFSLLITIFFITLAIVVYYQIALFITGIVYILSGPMEYFIKVVKNKNFCNSKNPKMEENK